MREVYTFIRSREWLAVTLGTAVGVLAVTGLVSAATTISTDVTTAGNVFATSTIVATGAMQGYSTLGITGLASFTGNASSTGLSVFGKSFFGGSATTTIDSSGNTLVAGTLAASSTLQVTGATTLYNNLIIPAAYSLDTLAAGTLNIGTTTANLINIGSSAATTSVLGPVTVRAAGTIDAGTAGALYIGTSTANAIGIGKAGVTTSIAGLANSTGNASTTLLSIGGSTGNTLNTVLFGFCTLAAVTVNATTTNGVACTGATGLDTTFTRVFVMATSTLPSGVTIQQASTTATATINVMLFNAGGIGNATISSSTVSLNYWAVK